MVRATICLVVFWLKFGDTCSFLSQWRVALILIDDERQGGKGAWVGSCMHLIVMSDLELFGRAFNEIQPRTLSECSLCLCIYIYIWVCIIYDTYIRYIYILESRVSRSNTDPTPIGCFCFQPSWARATKLPNECTMPTWWCCCCECTAWTLQQLSFLFFFLSLSLLMNKASIHL